VTDYTYTGQRVEMGFGLYDYNARFYSARLGRFVSADTMVPEPSNSQAFNRYGYANNNPIRYKDPSGHEPCDDIPGFPCTSDMIKPLREMWNYGQRHLGQTVHDTQQTITEALTDPSGLALSAVKAGVPTTIGVQFSAGGGANYKAGKDESGSLSIVYNWYSDELSAIVGGADSNTLAFPLAAGFNGGGSVQLLAANGATTTEALTGPSNIFSINAAADEGVKESYVASYAYSLDKDGYPARDKTSLNTINVATAGVGIGANQYPSLVKVMVANSPGTNNSWQVLNIKHAIRRYALYVGPPIIH
jgi:RHS repeat-associated protein